MCLSPFPVQSKPAADNNNKTMDQTSRCIFLLLYIVTCISLPELTVQTKVPTQYPSYPVRTKKKPNNSADNLFHFGYMIIAYNKHVLGSTK